ncbi:hypothetical protein JCM8208_006429 [Rhodotorula glutinis]
MLAVRSFLLVSLGALLSILATARTDPLRPPLHSGHLSHESPLHPSALSTRTFLRARQATLPAVGEATAVREAQAQRDAVSQLDGARRAIEVVGGDVARRAERVKRAQGGFRERETADEEGAAVHDTLFRLIQILSSSPSSATATMTVTSDDPLDAIAIFAAAQRRPGAAAPSASAAPVPSGHRDPLTALTALLDTLDRTISVPLGDILPSLPPVLRDSVRALLESVGEETAGVVEGALLQGGIEVAGAEQVLLRLGGEVDEGKEQRTAALLQLVRGSVAGI